MFKLIEMLNILGASSTLLGEFNWNETRCRLVFIPERLKLGLCFLAPESEERLATEMWLGYCEKQELFMEKLLRKFFWQLSAIQEDQVCTVKLYHPSTIALGLGLCDSPKNRLSISIVIKRNHN